MEIIRLNYDVDAAADALRKEGAPESYAQSATRGLFLDAIIAARMKLEKDMEKKCHLIVRRCRRIAEKVLARHETFGTSEKTVS